MGGVDYGEALKKIESEIAKRADDNQIDSSTKPLPINEEGLDYEDDNHDDLYN
jgi:hypothetical protein